MSRKDAVGSGDKYNFQISRIEGLYQAGGIDEPSLLSSYRHTALPVPLYIYLLWGTGYRKLVTKESDTQPRPSY